MTAPPDHLALPEVQVPQAPPAPPALPAHPGLKAQQD
jgi:hypothetical protein